MGDTTQDPAALLAEVDGARGWGATLPSQSVRIVGDSLGHKQLQGHVLLQP